MLLVATAGAATANSYCTVAEATTLLPLLLHTDLQDGDVLLQLSDALMWATQLIEAQVDWYWVPLTDAQALSWPLDGAVDPRGRTISTATIPPFLKLATAEYALALLRETTQQQAALPALTRLQGLQSLTIDDVRMEAGDLMTQQVTAVAAAQHIPAVVRRLLTPYGDVAGGGAVRLTRT